MSIHEPWGNYTKLLDLPTETQEKITNKISYSDSLESISEQLRSIQYNEFRNNSRKQVYARRKRTEKINDIRGQELKTLINRICGGHRQVSWALQLLSGKKVTAGNRQVYNWQDVRSQRNALISLDNLVKKMRKVGIRIEKKTCDIVGLEGYYYYRVRSCPKEYRVYIPKDNEEL